MFVCEVSVLERLQCRLEIDVSGKTVAVQQNREKLLGSVPDEVEELILSIW
jgi:hypothetical protein